MPEASFLRRHKLPAQEVADHILKLLPEDGTPVLNRVMRTMLAREFRQPIEPELYFSARNLLLNNDQIGRLRGQGGQLFALSSGEASEPVANEKERWAERELMQPLEKYLNGTFRKGLDLPEDGHWIVHDTSSRGPLRGQWARPDYILVTAMRFKLLPGCQIDVHSFELKTETGGNVQAVHEALAQTRSTHFGHLVWHLPEGSKEEARLAEISKHCDEHGIGLIRIREPARAESYEILIDPERKATPSMAILRRQSAEHLAACIELPAPSTRTRVDF
jgi:hypothetical protein